MNVLAPPAAKCSLDEVAEIGGNKEVIGHDVQLLRDPPLKHGDGLVQPPQAERNVSE